MSSVHSADHDSLFDSYIDSSAYLDQSFCSNFSCCGQNLPDLHHLLDHFEEEHVLPLPQTTDPSTPAPYILSYPQPNPPLQPINHPISAAHGPLRAVPDLHHVPDLTYSPASIASPSPLCLPPALFSFQPPRSCTPPPHSSDDADENVLDSPRVPSIARSSVGPQRTAKQHPRTDPLSRSRPVAQTPERPSSSRRRDGREKMYKCPYPGCTKSYLNPNGLKYHLEKGTCTNADERPRGPLPPGAAAAALAPASVATTPEPPSHRRSPHAPSLLRSRSLLCRCGGE
ncbi:hypothetical protein C8Q70DRAFT_1112811 [Cubamyces menziesii]|nr:hypothetical protein C8Q70DRAFT_1112811 [Cubamyces menziesii]